MTVGQGPLRGVRVIDLSRLVAGNQLTMLLGDFGADVIKVEHPRSGDSLRQWRTGGQELYWKVYGRNKRSVTLDLVQPLGPETTLRLIEDTHIVVESFRPGTLERLGLAPEVLLDRNPSLVIVRISGWGQTGSRAQRPGFGTLVEAMAGFAAMNGFDDREPVLPPFPLADMVAGTYGAFAVVSALRHAESTGQGQVIDLSLFEPLFSVLGPQAAAYRRTNHRPRRTGSRSQNSAPRNVYRTVDDKWIALSGSTQPMAKRLFTALGRPELINDPRFVDNTARLAHATELDTILAEHFASRTLAESLHTLEEAGVTAAPVAEIGDLVDSDYFATRQVVVDGPDIDSTDSMPMHNIVPRLTQTPGAIRRPAPRPGQHNREVLAAVLSTEEWEELIEARMVQP